MPEAITDVVDGLVFRPAAGRVARLVSWGAVQAGVDALAV